MFCYIKYPIDRQPSNYKDYFQIYPIADGPSMASRIVLILKAALSASTAIALGGTIVRWLSQRRDDAIVRLALKPHTPVPEGSPAHLGRRALGTVIL